MSGVIKLGHLVAMVAAAAGLVLAGAGGSAFASHTSSTARARAVMHHRAVSASSVQSPFTVASGTVDTNGVDTNTSFCYKPSPAPTSLTNDPVNPTCQQAPGDTSLANPEVVPTPYPGWAAPLGSSQWVGPQSNGRDSQEKVPAWYIYDAQFDGCATISGTVLADNEVGVFLNGNYLASGGSSTSPLSFSAAGWYAGTNVVDFVVRDASRPATGADYSFTVTPAPCSSWPAGTWSGSPGGSTTAATKALTINDTTSGLSISCTLSTADGTAKSGRGLTGAGIWSIKELTASSCTGDHVALSFRAGSLPYALNAVSYDAATGVTTVTLTGIRALLSGSGCTMEVGGTTSTSSDGQVTATYTNKTHTLELQQAGGNLHIWHVTGCRGAVSSGDAATLTGTYTVVPGQTLASP